MFVERFSNDFKEHWNIIKEDGTIQKVYLNKNYYNPTLTYGWFALQTYYTFLDNVEVKFSYNGLNLFKVTSFNELFCPTEIAIFHSRSLMPTEVKYFDIQL